MNAIQAAAAGLIALRLGASLALAALNRRETLRRSADPPPWALAIMDPPTQARAVRYTLAKSRFGSVEEIFEAAVLAAAVFSGVLPKLAERLLGLGEPGAAWTGALFILVSMVLLSAFSLPFDAWEQFRLEKAFGFCRTSARLWATDKAKLLVLSCAIGYPLVWAVLLLARVAGSGWWIWGFALVFGFQLAMAVLYPRFILPLFNKLSPLPEGPLRERLLALGERTGFRTAAIQVMDGSRRSAHSNAFFAGFGALRRIVLFDTLIAQLSPEELEATLAHEVGHYRLGHIPRRLAVQGALLAAGFAVLAWLARSPWFNASFGFPAGQTAASFLLFGLLSGLIAFWFSPVANALSRRHEYQADAFAREAIGGPAPLVSALHKLAEKNLTNLTPHPWFGLFYHSHPTIAEREQALRG